MINKEQYKKLYVLSPKYFEKIQKQSKTNQISLNQPLDKVFYNILQNKEPDVYRKWLMYKNALIKFRQTNDNNDLNFPDMKTELKTEDQDTGFRTPHFDKLLKKDPSYYWDSEFYNNATPVTTKPSRKSVAFSDKLTKHNSTLFNEYRSYNNAFNDTSSSNDSSFLNRSRNSPFDSTRNQNNEEIFDYNPNNSQNNIDEEVEQEIFQVAKKSLGEKNEQNIVRLDDTLNDDHRVFENRKTKDIVAIEVDPIKNYVKNDIPLSLNKEVEVRTDVSPIIQKENDYNFKEYQPKFIRVATTPLQSNNQSRQNPSLQLRSRAIKRRKSTSFIAQPKTKKTKKSVINQPQRGNGFTFNWKPYNQKRYK